MDKNIDKRIEQALKRRVKEQKEFIQRLARYYPTLIDGFTMKVRPTGYLQEEWLVYGNNSKLLGSKRYDLVKENE
jgi:hypothetical protein